VYAYGSPKEVPVRVRDQLIGAVTLSIATYFGALRIAEAKCDAAVGSRGELLDTKRAEDFEAFQRLERQLNTIGQAGLAERLEELRLKERLWVAPALGPGRWAAYVESLGLVRRIYIRRVALRDPSAHLYPMGALGVPPGYQAAFGWVSLGGAMRHELAHYEGAIEEADAYRIELAWYEEVRRSGFMSGLQGELRDAWVWAIDSAVTSAHAAARRAGAAIP
jgi:hypothetical protein